MYFTAMFLGTYMFKISIFLENFPLAHHGMFPTIPDDFLCSKLLYLKLTRALQFSSDMSHIPPATVCLCLHHRLQASLILFLGKSGRAALLAGTTGAAVRSGARGRMVHLLAIPTRVAPIPGGTGELAVLQVGRVWDSLRTHMENALPVSS